MQSQPAVRLHVQLHLCADAVREASTVSRTGGQGVQARRVNPAGRRALGARGLLTAGWKVTLGSLILAMAALLILGLAARPRFLFDFRGDIYNAAVAILHGHNPYRIEYLNHLAWIKRHAGAVPPAFAVPVYPAPVLLASVPFGLVPLWLGGILFIAASIAGVVWGLRMFGVRDWRCIALVLVSWPCLFGLWFGTLSPLLVLGAGVAWRARDRAARCAGALGSLVLAKIFPWPLAFWPLVARRWRTFALAIGLMAITSLAAWAVIGIGSLGTYPHVLSTLSYVERNAGVSLTTTLIAFGVAPSLAEFVALACAGAMAAAAWQLSRRGEIGMRSAFGLLVMAALTAAPLVWVHYEVLLFVPIALISPSLSPIWFIPLLSAFLPVPHFHNHLQLLLWPCLQGLVVVGLARSAGAAREPGRQAAWLRWLGADSGQYAESGS
jgi:Glycosyltransferase family 87